MSDPFLILVWVLGLAIAAALVWIVVRALGGDRYRGTPRCPRCWHDQTGVPGFTCPECGHAMRREADRRRTRRRWGPALAAIALLVGGAIALRVRVTEEGPWAFVPTRVLVALLPWSEGGFVPGPLQIELLGRIGRDGISSANAERLVDRMLAGDAAARPVTPEWEDRYGRFAFELAEAARTRGQNRLAGWDGWNRLAALPPRIDLPRVAWPRRDGPLVVELDARAWWPGGTQARLAVRDPGAAIDPTPIGFDPAGSGPPVQTILLEPPRAGERTRRLRIELARREPDAAAEPGPWVPAGHLDATIDLPEAPLLADDAAWDAIDTPELAERLRGAFSDGLIAWGGADRRYGFRFDPGRTREPEFEGLLVGLVVEVLEGDEVRRRSRIWWPAGPVALPRGGFARWEISEEDRDALARLPDDGVGWSVRIRGDRALALRAVTAPTVDPTAFRGHWAGTLSFPLVVRPVLGTAPPRRYFPPDGPDRPIP